MTKYAIIIGGFHVAKIFDKLERDIYAIINEVNTQTIFLLQDNGEMVTQNWPLSFQTRVDLLRETFPNHSINICPLPHCELSVDWTTLIEDRLDILLPTNATYTIYLSEMAAKDYCPKKYKNITVIKDFKTNHTPNIRLDFKNIHIATSYRLGLLESHVCSLGRVYPTVDIALTKIANMQRMILVGKKKNESFYRLPGGFVDKNDETRQLAARRELYEETNLTVEGNLISLGDFKIDDWRYQNTTDSILTTLFLGEYSYGIPKAGDDLVKEVAWIPLDTADVVIGKAHKPLISKVKEYYDIKN
jgi:bifunctional NMN adenylyltransferase/nudix hydrolase